MKIARWIVLTGLTGLAAHALAGAPDQAVVQGLYEGTGGGAAKLEVRVVAQADNAYRVLVRKLADDGSLAGHMELAGTTKGEEVAFRGKDGAAEWQAVYKDGAITGTCGNEGKIELKKVVRLSPTLGKRPDGAILLFDGKPGMENLVRSNGAPWYVGDKSMDGKPVWEVPVRTITGGDPAEWPTPDKPLPQGWTLGTDRRRVDSVLGIGEDGSIQIPSGGMKSRREFNGIFDYHVEFMVPLMPGAHSQGRGNSGCYLPNGEEIQVLDSFGECTYLGGGCGGIYRYQDPSGMDVIDSIANKEENKYSLAAAPPLQWQTYDMEYRSNESGQVRLTVYHNGIKIHNEAVLHNPRKRGPFQFQDHGCPVRYRNIWVAVFDGP